MRPGGGALATAAGLAVLALVALPVAGLVGGVLGSDAARARFEAVGLPAPQAPGAVLALMASTLALALVVAAAALTLGTLLAWCEQRVRLPGGALLALGALLPLAVPSYVLAAAFQRAAGPRGWLGAALGVEERPAGFGAAALVLTIVCTPYAHLLVGAALARLSAAEEEAARSLGAGAWSRFFRIVLPRLRPALAFAFLIVLLYVMADFGAVSVLDCRVLSWRIYQAQAAVDVPSAVRMGLGMMALVVPLLVLARAIGGRARPDTVANPRRAPRRRAGPLATALAVALHLLVLGAGVVVPVVEMAGWVRDGRARGEVPHAMGGALVHSAVLAGSGALLVLALALVTAWAVARRPGPLARLVDDGVFALGGLPGILVALGLSLAALHAGAALEAPSLRRLLARGGVLLMLGYAARVLAEGHGVVRAALARLDPRLDEVARSLGAGRARRVARVLLPALAPSLVAAFLLVFLALVKELPVTLMLAPPGWDTLAYRVWERYTEAFLADAGRAGLLLVALALGVQLVTLRWRRHA